MKKISVKKIDVFIIFISLFLVRQSFSAIILQGDPQAVSGETFSMPIGTYLTGRSRRSLYISALPPFIDSVKNFALSAISRDLVAFTPLAPAQVTINGVADQPNPLYSPVDNPITFMAIIDSGPQGVEHPLFVLQNDVSTIYGLDNFTNPTKISLLSAQNIRDAFGNVTSGIVQIAASANSGAFAAGGTAFAAVKPNGGGNFGDVGSGIALALFGITVTNEDKTNFKAFVPIDAATGQNIAIPKAIALDKTSSFLQIQNELANIQNIVAMHYNPYNNLLYIGLQVQVNAAPVDGARSLVVGIFDAQNKITLFDVAPPAAFDAQNQIVGALGANAQISIQEIASMKTSTYLLYLIVRGGNGNLAATNNFVYALPLVAGNTDDSETINGTIANKNAEPVDFFSTVNEQFIKRAVTVPAVLPVDMPTNTDLAAQVGGGQLVGAGDINHIFVSGDSVFVVTGGQGPESGIFYSQALFNANGTIRAWTQWQRYAGASENLFGAFLDENTSLVTYLTGANNATVKTVERTQWSPNINATGASVLNNEIGSVYGLFDLPIGTPALNNTSLLLSLGFDSLTLVQTGVGVSGIATQTPDFSSTQNFKNGTIDTPIANNPTIITISGGALSDIGPLTAAEVARNGNNGNQAWLFCGGCKGLAVLSLEDGSGIVGGQLGNNFAGLIPNMTFTVLGNYSLVRALVSDGNYLYVLTDAQLDRIDLTVGNPTPDTIAGMTTTIATTEQLLISSFGSFLSFVVSNNFALLGTTDGLFRVANSSQVTSARVAWSAVPVAEGALSVKQMYAASKTGRPQDVAAMGGGQVYVLTADQGNNRSRVNRFVVADVVNAGVVNDNSLVPFPDIYVENTLSFLASFGEFRNLFVTDGALGFNARAKELGDSANVKFLLSASHNGLDSIPAPVDISSSIGLPYMVQVSSFGSWLVGNDQGIQINN